MKVLRNTTAMAALFISMLTISCSNDEPAFPTDPDDITFTAPTEIENPSSRVSYTQISDRIKVEWQQGDKVYLVDKNGNKLLEFTIESEPTATKAIFTCTDVITKENLSKVSGTLIYNPDGATSVYEQKQSASGNTDHLKSANVIQSNETINGAALLEKTQTVTFKNNTAIFRVIVKPNFAVSSGSSLRVFGSSAWDGGKGVILTMGFPTTKGDTDTLYVAVPTGKVNLVFGIGILNTSNYPVYEYRQLLKKDYEPGKEYTADLTKYITNVTTVDAGDDKYYGYIDLGLENNTKWATMNIGAKDFVSEGSYGKYFKWGAINSGTSSQQDEGRNLPTIDEITSKGYYLQPDYDAAHNAWGDNWRMPTYAECQELISNCTWTWCDDLQCYVVYKKIDETKGESAYGRPLLLLPAAGYKESAGTHDVGSIANYWTSSAISSTSAYCLTISHTSTECVENETPTPQTYACPIRPVYIGK